jgi:uncharacterized membrane protein
VLSVLSAIFKKSARVDQRNRSAFIDQIRGFVIVNMVIYHFCYASVKLYGAQWAWFRGFAAGAWQEFICCSFLIIAGLCTRFSSNRWKRSLIVGLCAAIITIAAYLFNKNQPIVFGILHCMAVCMLITAATYKLLDRTNAIVGIAVSIALALITWHTTRGYFGFGELSFKLPTALYETNALFAFGIKSKSFRSVDYFPLFPYLFVFLAGRFLGAYTEKLPKSLYSVPFDPLAFLGRHSLIIYMIHQPIIIAAIYLFLRLRALNS